jgi:hypothetical protein
MEIELARARLRSSSHSALAHQRALSKLSVEVNEKLNPSISDIESF